MSGKPSNQVLYNQVKERVYAKMPKNSLYRSAQIQKLYKELGGTYTGKKKTILKAGWENNG